MFPKLSEYGSIGNIPIRRKDEDDIALGMVCQKLLNRKGKKRVVIITKHNDLEFGIEKLNHILEFYRAQKEIRSICLMAPDVVDDLEHNYKPKAKVH